MVMFEGWLSTYACALSQAGGMVREDGRRELRILRILMLLFR